MLLTNCIMHDCNYTLSYYQPVISYTDLKVTYNAKFIFIHRCVSTECEQQAYNYKNPPNTFLIIPINN